MTWWKAVIAGVLALGALGIIVGGLRERPPPATEVQVSKAKKGTIARTVAGAGKLQAATTVKISSSISGDVLALPVKVGDRVTKGQVLGRIDRRRFEAASKQALAAQSAARADMQVTQVEVDRTAAEYERAKGLVQKGLASTAELEQAAANRDAAVARLASARERLAQAAAGYEEAQDALSKTTLVAPIDGTVLEVLKEVGERVRGSEFNEDPVMQIAALAAMEVKIEVSEHEVVHLKTGQEADVSVDALEGQTFDGQVVEIAQTALIKNAGTEAEVTSFPVTVALATRPPGVLPGMSAEVRITAETRENAVTVPIQAVTVRPDKSLPDYKPPVESGTSIGTKKRAETLAKVVFVVEGDKAKARRVRTGIASDNELEILEGLNEGESIIEGPYRTLAKDLQDGALIRDKAAAGPGGGPTAKKG